MSTLDNLATPNTTGMTEAERMQAAAEDRRVAMALRERCGVLYDACDGQVAWLIAELDWFAQALMRSAYTYADQEVQ